MRAFIAFAAVASLIATTPGSAQQYNPVGNTIQTFTGADNIEQQWGLIEVGNSYTVAVTYANTNDLVTFDLDPFQPFRISFTITDLVNLGIRDLQLQARDKITNSGRSIPSSGSNTLLDGVVLADTGDYYALRVRYPSGTTAGSWTGQLTLSAVPEPVTGLLFGFATVAIAGLARQTRGAQEV